MSSQNSETTIVPATPNDLLRILALLDEASLPSVGVKEALSRFIVAKAGDDIVGVIGLEVCGDRIALLRSAAVAPAWRGRGVGTELVERVIAAAKAEGFDALYLLTTTAESYFPNFGFARIDRGDAPAAIQSTAEFSSACPATAALMALRLGAAP
jgi:amino-acid N-acetyltransferase